MTASAKRKTALITGASAGIGRAFAHEYARRAVDLVVVARRGARLRALGDELSEAHGIEVTVVESDLSDPDAPRRIEEAVTNAGIDIDILVNNAGYGVPGAFMSSPLATHQAFQRVMVEAVMELCHRFLPGMRARRRGTIINVASLAGHLPGMAGGHTLYGAAKAWMIVFSEALAHELRPEGIWVCALCPGFTETEFHDVNGTRAHIDRLPRYLLMTAAEVAREGVEAAARGQVVFINGRVNRALALVPRLLPRRLFQALVGRRAREFRDRR